jgi:GAF domain-containing protein
MLREEVAMKKQLINYETFIRITKGISHSKDPEEIVLITVEGIKSALDAKGCALFLVNRKTRELEVAASYGLSAEYVNKGPVSAIRSIAQSLEEGPIAIYDVNDDPRIQYPEAAQKEGIASILSVPIVTGTKMAGALRVYTAEPWEFTLDDVNFVQALAQITGMAIEMSRLYQGQKEAIDILKKMREVQTKRTKRRTPFEGVPVSVRTDKVNKKRGR